MKKELMKTTAVVKNTHEKKTHILPTKKKNDKKTKLA